MMMFPHFTGQINTWPWWYSLASLVLGVSGLSLAVRVLLSAVSHPHSAEPVSTEGKSERQSGQSLRDRIFGLLDDFNHSVRRAQLAPDRSMRLGHLREAEKTATEIIPLVEWACQTKALSHDAIDLQELRSQRDELRRMVAALEREELEPAAVAAANGSGYQAESPPFTLIERAMLEPLDWSDVVLADDCLRELQQIQRLLTNRNIARQLGVELPRGMLLYGPPGTGKTTIARVLASQAQCTFLVVTPAEIRSRWWGQSENNVKRLFDAALEKAPTIIFFDEVDALLPVRGGEAALGDATINQMLSAIDGVIKREGIYVVGATNRLDIVDPALLRGGRLTRKIFVPLPGLPERDKLLFLFTRGARLADSVNLENIAQHTEGFSGADLRALVNQAGLNALERFEQAPESPRAIMMRDFKQAYTEIQTRPGVMAT